MKIALYGRPGLNDQAAEVRQLLDAFLKANASLWVYKPLLCLFETEEAYEGKYTVFSERGAFPEKLDFFVTIGGDGTLLDAVDWVGERQIPVLGINFGRLGFLTSAVP